MFYLKQIKTSNKIIKKENSRLAKMHNKLEFQILLVNSYIAYSIF